MKSLEVGAVINKALKEDAQLSRLTNNNIFPVVAEDCTFPFIVFKRTSLIPDRFKFGSVDDIDVEVVVISDKYKESITVAQRVRELLDNKHIDQNAACYLVDSSESYSDADAYRQNLIFKIENNG